MTSIMKRPPPNTSIMPPSQPTSSATNNQTFVEKIMIGLDHAPLQFDLRGQLIGAGGANLHYIRNETGAIATLRGRGSMFIEPALGTESADPMHLYIEHPRFDGLQSAKQLAKNLIETLQQELTLFLQQQPPVVQPSNQLRNPPPTMLHPPGPIGSMSVPPPILSVPPPSIVAQQQSATSTQNPSLTEIISKVPPPNLMHSLPINFQPPTIRNVNIPPPALPAKPIQMLHLQGPPPNQIQLSQPPPNMQPNAQLVLNPPPQNFQYQYIQQLPLQSQNDLASNQPGQVTIQHIYQSNQSQSHFNPFATQSPDLQRQAPQFGAGQQFFVQGNNAFVVPPPNIMQTTQSADGKECPTPQQSIIFHTQPPPNLMQLPPIHFVESHQTPIDHETKGTVDESIPRPKSPKQQEASSLDDTKQGVLKLEPDSVESPIVPHSDIVTQLMSVPPPITCVQHIVGNTLITTTQPPNQSDQQNVYSQIPVSIQQSPQQQIHLSTQNGQHFFVHAQQWAQQPSATQIQHHVPQAGFQLTASQQLPPPNDTLRHQQILTTTTFNSQQLQTAAAGLQVQFHQQLQPAARQQHFIQQFPAAVSMAQLIDQHQQPLADQMQFHSMPPSYTVATIHQTGSNQALIDSFVHQPRLGIPPLSGPNSVPSPMAKTNIVDTQLRIGQKRKLDEDAAAQRKAPTRSGIGSSGSIFVNTQQQRTELTQLFSHQQSHHQQKISGNSSTFLSNHSSPDFMTTTAQIASTSLTTTSSHSSSSSSSSSAQDNPNNAADAHDKDESKSQRIPHNQRDQSSDNYESSGHHHGHQQRSVGPHQSRHPFDGGRDSRMYRSNGPRDFAVNYPMRPPMPSMHMHDVNFPMNRMNFGPPPPPPYGPPPHFRQW